MMMIKCLSIFVLSLMIYAIESYIGKRNHAFSSAILIILVYLMAAGNYQNADTKSYEITYHNNQVQTTIQLLGQWAYYLVINICNKLHLSFIQYRFVIYGVGYSALISAARRILENRFPFYCLYMLYPMVIDATQMKNFVAMCFVTLAITMLLDGKNIKKGYFIICIIIAAGFHVVSFVYLPLVILCDPQVKKRTKYISVIPVVLFAALFSNRRMSALLSGFVLSNLSDSLSARSSSFFLSRVNNGYLVYVLATLAIIYMIYRLRKAVINSKTDTTFERKVSNVVFYSALFSLTFLPLYFLRQDFSRLLRNLFPIFHICFVMTFITINKASLERYNHRLIIRVSNEKAFLLVVYLLLLAYMFFWDIYGYNETVLIPFLQYNSFFS